MTALGTSSFVHLASECRCPPSHPVIDPINSFRCTQHTGHSIDRGTVQRLNQQATPPGFMNNMHSGDQWISAINQPAANITIKLSYTNFNFEVRNGATLYEFKHISIHLYLIHRYFISYCILEVHVQKQQFYSSQMTMGKVILYFNIMLMTAWSISESQIIMTCVQQQIPRMFKLCYYIPYNLILLFSCICSHVNYDFRQIPTSGGFIQFVLPAESSITSDIRIQFIDFFNNSQTTTSHLYFSITETTIVGR